MPAQGDDQNSQNQNGSQNQDGETPTFEDWIASQDETVKGLLDTHTAGLKSALEKERDRAAKLEKSLREAAKKQEAGSAAQKELEQLADNLAIAKRENAFIVAAYKAGVNDPELALLAAERAGLIHQDGTADFTRLKETYPQLFGKVPQQTAGNAGNGTGNPPTTQKDMNAAIRTMAGRQ